MRNTRNTPSDTVDGKNPAPVDMVKIPLFTGFYTSLVVQDFFHQQYKHIKHRILVNDFFPSKWMKMALECEALFSKKKHILSLNPPPHMKTKDS